jgi:uncharacterized damage-inducible protein DinB
MIADKNPLLASQIKLWRDRIKPAITKGLESSPDDKLTWAPASGMISLGNLFTHISECSEWWFDQVIGNKQSVDSASSPKQLTLSRTAIEKYMDNHWERLEQFFACDPSIFKKIYKVAGRENALSYDGYWIFTHLLEHDIHHRSQINQYLRILGIEPPKI